MVTSTIKFKELLEIESIAVLFFELLNFSKLMIHPKRARRAREGYPGGNPA